MVAPLQTGIHELGGAEGQGDVERPPDFEARERLGCDADDRERTVEDGECASDDGLASAELRLPERMADHCGAGAAATAVVTRVEEPSPFRCNAEHREEVPAHPEAACLPCVEAPTDEQPGIRPGEDSGEGSLVGANQFPQRVGGLRVDAVVVPKGLRAIGAHFGELMGTGNRKGSEP